MKVLCILPDLNKCNGVVSYMMNYYYKTNHNEIQYDFLIINDSISNEYKKYITENNDNIIVFGKIRPNTLKNCIKNIKKIYTDTKYDIVYSHVLYTAFFFFHYANKFGIDVKILHSHNAPKYNKFRIKDYLYKIVTRISVNMATHYFACSDLSGKDLFKTRKYKLIRNAIYADKYFFNENVREDIRNKLDLKGKFVLGHVGRIDVEKNHKFLIDVFEMLKSKNDNVKLLLVGDGPLRTELEQYVENKKLKEDVIFLGIVEDVEKYLNAMDVFVFPSLFEGLGIAAIEAQFNGLPCVLADSLTKEVQISKNVDFLNNASTNIEKWCEAISKYENLSREYNIEELKKSGYDINEEANTLSEYLNEILEKRG